jgi:hypothetical protein
MPSTPTSLKLFHPFKTPPSPSVVRKAAVSGFFRAKCVSSNILYLYDLGMLLCVINRADRHLFATFTTVLQLFRKGCNQGSNTRHRWCGNSILTGVMQSRSVWFIPQCSRMQCL